MKNTPWKTLLSAGPVLAMAALAMPAGAEPYSDIEQAIEAFASLHDQVAVDSFDISQSGLDEVLLVEAGACGDQGCSWQLLAQDEDGLREIGSGTNHTVLLERTEPAGGVLYTDGVTWAFDGNGLYPYGDVIGLSQNRAASLDEITLINALPAYDGITHSSVMSWTFTYLHDGAPAFAHAHTITDWEYQIGGWGTPYAVFDNDGLLIVEGVSADYPRIFPDLERGGFTLIDVVPAGFIVRSFQ